MESHPRVQTALEGATIPRDEIGRRLFALINTELALDEDADMEYPEGDETLGSILEVAPTQDEIEGVVSDFVITQLPTYPEARHQRVVEIFASALPTHLSVNQQADLATIFDAGLRQAGLSPSLLDVFFDNLSEALEPRTPDSEFEFEPVPMDLEDVEVQPTRIFPWFECSTIIVRDPNPHADPSHGLPPTLADLYGPPPTREDLNNLIIDLNDIKVVFMDIQAQMSLMVDDIGASDDPLRAEAQQLLRESATELDMVLVPDEIAPGRAWIVKPGVVNAASILSAAIEKIFLVEKYLVAQESILLSTGETLKAHASRYERSRYRDCLKWHIDGFKTWRFLHLCVPQISVPEPTIRKYDESEPTCPICCYDLPEEGEICHPAAVSFACCNKGFHTDCLLGTCFAKAGHRTPCCPMCRKEWDLSFLGEILEQKVRELNVL